MTDFQNRVDDLMRDGMLFGAAVLHARAELKSAQEPVKRDERRQQHNAAIREGMRRAAAAKMAARITAEKKRHWKVA